MSGRDTYGFRGEGDRDQDTSNQWGENRTQDYGSSGLEGSNLEGSNLEGSNLEGSNLEGSGGRRGQDDSFGSSTMDKSFGGGDDSRGTDFMSSDTRGSDFTSSNTKSSSRRDDGDMYGIGVGGGDTARRDDDDSYGSSDRQQKKGDSTLGKMMEKTGQAFGSDNLQERGREKREDQGRDDY